MSQEAINDLAVTTLGMLDTLNGKMREVKETSDLSTSVSSEYLAIRQDLAMHLSSCRSRIINLGVRVNALIEKKGGAA